MAKATFEVISTLRKTIELLKSPTGQYAWTHQGHCNCGHLIQAVTELKPERIHASALEKPGDWSEHARDYCPFSGRLVDDLITTLINIGFTTQDIIHLERLSDPQVLSKMPVDLRTELNYKSKADVLAYLETWVKILESQIIESVNINLDKVLVTV